jgi:hypothetical protein
MVNPRLTDSIQYQLTVSYERALQQIGNLINTDSDQNGPTAPGDWGTTDSDRMCYWLSHAAFLRQVPKKSRVYIKGIISIEIFVPVFLYTEIMKKYIRLPLWIQVWMSQTFSNSKMCYSIVCLYVSSWSLGYFRVKCFGLLELFSGFLHIFYEEKALILDLYMVPRSIHRMYRL